MLSFALFIATALTTADGAEAFRSDRSAHVVIGEDGSLTPALYTGRSPNSDIARALRRVDAEWLSRDIALVTMLDSTPAVAELPSLVPLLTESGIAWTRVGSDVALPATALPELLTHEQVFAGFDEVWLLEAIPSHGKPGDVRITSDVPLSSPPSPELREWMTSSRAVAGLGDGNGLNFVTREAKLAELWRA